VPVVTISDSYEGMQYQGGVKVHHGVGWAMLMCGESLRRRLAAGGAPPADPGGAPPADPAAFDIEAATNRLPLVDQPVLAELAPYYHDWLSHPQPEAYWEPGSPSAAYERITAPALNVGGWFDIFLWGTLENYTGMRRRGGSEVARRNQRLIIGPWSHMNYAGSFPEREFGMGAGVRAIDLTGLHIRWYDRWLKGEPTGIDREPTGIDRDPPVKLFVMGIDQWRDEADWPLPDTQYRSYYLHSGGGANSLRGDGALSVEPPGDEPPNTFLYDPLRPVPTVGGQVLIPGGNGTGPRDQREVEARDDVLVYSTPILEHPVEVTGPVSLELFIAPGFARTLHRFISARHRLHRQAGRRAPRRPRHDPHRRDPAGPLPQRIGRARAHAAGRRLRLAARSVGHVERLSTGASHPARGLEQQLPALHAQQQHRRRCGDRAGRGVSARRAGRGVSARHPTRIS